MITSSPAAIGILALNFFQISGTPLWVILIIILIVILLLWWGLSRNKIQEKDQSTNLVEEEEVSAEPVAPVLAMSEPEAEVPEADQIAQVASFAAEMEVESVEPETADEVAIMVEEQEEVVALEPDDLKKIEGIGPKIAGILAYAGITTFQQLADTDVDTLMKIVREDAGIRIADPTTWPEQAALAAVGDWVGFEKLQSELTGGRKA